MLQNTIGNIVLSRQVTHLKTSLLKKLLQNLVHILPTSPLVCAEI